MQFRLVLSLAVVAFAAFATAAPAPLPAAAGGAIEAEPLEARAIGGLSRGVVNPHAGPRRTTTTRNGVVTKRGLDTDAEPLAARGLLGLLGGGGQHAGAGPRRQGVVINGVHVLKRGLDTDAKPLAARGLLGLLGGGGQHAGSGPRRQGVVINGVHVLKRNAVFATEEEDEA